MSLHLEFEPHSWYMGFAITNNIGTLDHHDFGKTWRAYIDNGNTGFIDELESSALDRLHAKIRMYHLEHHTGYGERIAKRRLAYLRGEIEAERISMGEIAELQALQSYIDPSDVLLLEWAGVKEKV